MGQFRIAAMAWFVISRLAYVVGVGAALRSQERRQSFTRRDGVEAGFRRFRRLAAIVMNNDGVAFVLVCVVTRGTMEFPVRAVAVIAGVVCLLLGIGTKVWAARRLGDGAYYWRDFFATGQSMFPDPPGPYRFLKNPMYTMGYLHTYGLALVLGSLPGLFASAFAQIAILVFHQVVEKPHFDRLVATENAGAAGQPALQSPAPPR